MTMPCLLSRTTDAHSARPPSSPLRFGLDWSSVGFLDGEPPADTLQTSTVYEAQAILLFLKASAGDSRLFIDESSDACARGLIQAQYHCVAREFVVRHVRNALGPPTEATISRILNELKAEGWPVRLV